MRTAGYTLFGLAALLAVLPMLPFVAWSTMELWSHLVPSGGFRTLSMKVEFEPEFPYFLAFYVLAIPICGIAGIVCLHLSSRGTSASPRAGRN